MPHPEGETIVSPRLYVGVFAILFVLALATTFISFVDLGPFNTVIALLIAAAKAILIVLFFMHVKFEGLLTFVFAIAGFCWLAIMLILTFADYYSRGWLPSPREVPPLPF